MRQSCALVAFCCLSLISLSGGTFYSSSQCKSSYELGSLVNRTVASYEVPPSEDHRPLFVSDSLQVALNSSNREETAFRLNVSSFCMFYLDFTLREVAIFLLNKTDFNQITFGEVLRGVFVPELQPVFEILFDRIIIQSNLTGNETLQHVALSYNLTVGNGSIAEILLRPFNFPDTRSFSQELGLPLYSFDLLNQTTTKLATILAVENPDELKDYELVHFVKVSLLGAEYFRKLQMTANEVRGSLHVSWVELAAAYENVTSVLEMISAQVPKYFRHLTDYILGMVEHDLQLLNVTLQEIVELTNKTVEQLQGYKVFPDLVTLIFDVRINIAEIDKGTRQEIGSAITEILQAYNVTLLQLRRTFNLTIVQIDTLSPFEIENLSARLTLIRYAANLNLTIAEVAEKVNMTEEELSNNLTVTQFHVVIRKLIVVRTFEVMSQMLGVQQSFLTSSFDITAPVFSLTMCNLDGYLKTTRRTVLNLRVVVRKSLAFVVQSHGFSITFVRKLTIEKFIIRVMRLPSIREFFALNVLKYNYSSNYLRILLKYDFTFLEHLFKIHGDIPSYPYSIFRYSIVWIINRIIFLETTDVNECWRRIDRCHSRAQCINLPGTYECRCPPRGFIGKYCEDINECKDGSAVCPSGSSCLNTPGSYRCICRPGFLYNSTSKTCYDINECENIYSNDCNGGNECVNTVGSYVCRCPKGFYYNSFFRLCFDINECFENPSRCSDIDSNAYCQNKRGSFECKCRLSGFLEPVFNNSVSPRVFIGCRDINECARGNACPKYSQCINTFGGYRCSCLPGFKLHRGKCRVDKFVSLITRWTLIFKKRTYKTVSIPSGFPYFGSLHKKAHVCHNGLVSIGKRYCRPNPKRLGSLRKNVIAAFWANTDITIYSDVKYQVVEGSTEELRQQLDNISALIRNCSGESSFQATWMLIVTWEKVSPYARYFFGNPYTDEQSTYQLVLATNGTSSFAVYLYEDGGMGWTRRLGRRCAVGYATEKRDYSYQEEDSFKENIFSIDSKQFLVNGVTKTGFFCKSLNAPNTPLELTNEQRCMNWYNNEPDPDSWLDELSDCPATRRHIRRDNRYRWTRSRTWDSVCYELRFPTRRFGASQQCCYSTKRGRKRNAFVSDARDGGRAYRYHYKFNKDLRKLHDEEPFAFCCSAGSDLCSLFYEKRPLSTAVTVPERPRPCICHFFGCLFGCNRRPRRRRPFRRFFRAWFFGDPHISTLDGLQYTFNGLGDYVLIRTLDGLLHLHGRTERPERSEGKLSNATVFSGFALKTNTSDTAQIEFDDSKTGNMSITVILQNGSCSHHSIEYFNEAQDFKDMSIEKSSVNNNTVVVSFPSGFSIEVTPGIRLLQITVNANGDMMNNTEGLLGKFNGDKSDDLQSPNGTTIPANATEKEIFHLGQQWRVPHDERLFVSSNCTLQSVFFDANFIPSFFNLSSVSLDTKRLCGDNRECLFDVAATGNKELGKESAGFEEENQNLVNELANTPPEIQGPAEVNVTLNQTIHFHVTTSDPDNDTVTLEIDVLPPGANFVSATGHFDWTPMNVTNVTLDFVATDSKNSSSVLTVIINMCKCENNGGCDFSQFIGDSSGPLRIVGCNCSDQFEGTFCETEVLDACADDPCFDNVTCSTQTNPYGFQCGPCPVGLAGDGQDCFENDECANASVSRCNQTCVNTFGSFRCECHHGYISRDQGRICEDVNECQEAGNLMNNCSENAMCMNFPGSYNCSCNPGYEGDPYSNCTDKNECTNGDALCSQICVNTPGSFHCSCREGFQLAANQLTCEDVNECSTGHNCERICENLIGSYQCKCPAGFELNADNATCKVAAASQCDNTNGGCSQICVNQTGLVTCYCNQGYNLTVDGKNCSDIDECMMGTHDCSQICSNNEGSFTCGCPAGYLLAADGKTCIDEDECMNSTLNDCNQICTNKMGSYECSCANGFTLQSDNTSCADINECDGSPANSPCNDGSCVNVPGSFQCRCPVSSIYSEGQCKGALVYSLRMTLQLWNGRLVLWKSTFLDKTSPDFGFLARGIETECDRFFRRGRFRGQFLRCLVRSFREGSVIADVDLNFAGSATNVTPDILRNQLTSSEQMGNLTYDLQALQLSDFDECADDSTNNCHAHAHCINNDGSFTCKCKDGYLGDGKMTCDPAPVTAPSEDDNSKKTVIIICAVVFSCLFLALFGILFCKLRGRRNKEEFEYTKGATRVTSSSANSDEHFYTKNKPGKTGSYNVSPVPQHSRRAPSVASGEYDYPDPSFRGKRTTYYDNPAVIESPL